MDKFIKLTFVFILYVLSFVLQSIFVLDYGQQWVVLVFHLGLLGLLDYVLDLELKEALITVLIIGFIMDVFSYGYLFLNTLSYGLAFMVILSLASQINDTKTERLFLGIVAIFIFELIKYLLLRILGISGLSIFNWLTKRIILTLLVHIPLGYFVLLIVKFKNQILMSRNQELIRAEASFYRRQQTEKK